jgi:hypothetical protein
MLTQNVGGEAIRVCVGLKFCVSEEINFAVGLFEGLGNLMGF